MRDRLARASGHLLQGLHILHLLHRILPATLGHMPVLPANYNQGEITTIHGVSGTCWKSNLFMFLQWKKLCCDHICDHNLSRWGGHMAIVTKIM